MRDMPRGAAAAIFAALLVFHVVKLTTLIVPFHLEISYCSTARMDRIGEKDILPEW